LSPGLISGAGKALHVEMCAANTNKRIELLREESRDEAPPFSRLSCPSPHVAE
jgi:hypothetical protein